MKTRKIFKGLMFIFAAAFLVFGVTSAFAVPVEHAGGYAALFSNPTHFFSSLD